MRRLLVAARRWTRESAETVEAAETEALQDRYAAIRMEAETRHPRRRVNGKSAAGSYRKWRRERDARSRRREKERKHRGRSARERLEKAGAILPPIGWII